MLEGGACSVCVCAFFFWVMWCGARCCACLVSGVGGFGRVNIAVWWMRLGGSWDHGSF